MQDGKISYDEFVAMMKTGRRKASRQLLNTRGRFNSLGMKLIKDGLVKLSGVKPATIVVRPAH